MNDLPCVCVSLVVFVDDDILFLVSLTTTHEELAYRPPQLSVEAYMRSAREGGA
jgi:hypothetical protein